MVSIRGVWRVLGRCIFITYSVKYGLPYFVEDKNLRVGDDCAYEVWCTVLIAPIHDVEAAEIMGVEEDMLDFEVVDVTAGANIYTDEADHADCDIPLTQRDSSILWAKIACGYGRTDLVWEEFDETAFDDVVLKFPYILELEFVMLKSTYVHVSMAKHLENIPMTHKEVFSSFIVTSSIKTTTFKGIEIILANLYFLLVQDLTLSMLCRNVRLLSMVTKLDERRAQLQQLESEIASLGRTSFTSVIIGFYQFAFYARCLADRALYY
ncbi:hypothetical protein FNV43_RR27011 [Rhamnella rubrinervis]|uniref:Uncharacterized protein n=1 Tax=Rhamnella rubrinervis TaxID=2594499 RepID=A0A8K0DJL4_9ROSA|nr:hypothetical protein FNV43_RR27011 [Rhamnella rubrinervis]